MRSATLVAALETCILMVWEERREEREEREERIVVVRSTEIQLGCQK